VLSRPEPQTVLELDRVTVAAVERPAPILDAISCSLRANEILGIVGETGAGKSVLARAVLGLLPSGLRMASGDVRLEGRSVQALVGEERRHARGGRIALIGTNAKALLDPVTTVGRQVARVLRAHKPVSAREAEAQAIDLLREVGITDPARRA
jgi:peptide/nickel transport system ATP-binding protein